MKYYGTHSCQRRPNRQARGGIFRNRGINHPIASELLFEVLHRTARIPRAPQSLPDDEHARILTEKLRVSFAQCTDITERPHEYLKNMLQYLTRIGLGRILCKADRVLDQVTTFRLHCIHFFGRFALGQQHLAQEPNWVSFDPLLEVVFPLDSHVHVPRRAYMPTPANSAAFNKSGADAIAGSVDGARRSVPYRENIVAVNSDGLHTVQLPCTVNVVTHAPFRQMQVTRIEVVLADEQHRQ